MNLFMVLHFAWYFVHYRAQYESVMTLVCGIGSYGAPRQNIPLELSLPLHYHLNRLHEKV